MRPEMVMSGYPWFCPAITITFPHDFVRLFPPFLRGVRGDLDKALTNPPKSPFKKGGLKMLLEKVASNGKLDFSERHTSASSGQVALGIHGLRFLNMSAFFLPLRDH